MSADTKKPRPEPTPKNPQAWDRPPLPSSGDENNDATFAAVGRALSQWEYFEGYLGLLYGQLVGWPTEASDQVSPAMRAYGAIAGFSSRLDMLKEATKAYFFLQRRDQPPEFEKIFNEATNFSARRNEIAHGIVQPYYSGGLVAPGYALGPSRYATRKLKLSRTVHAEANGVEQLYAYTSREIDHFRACFEALANNTLPLTTEVITSRRRDTTGL